MSYQGRGALAVAGALMLAAWLNIGGATQAYACQEKEVADRAGAAFLNAAKQGSASGFASALSSYADMDKITLFALGRYQSQLHPNRRAELTHLTARYVSTTLADFASKFRGSSISAIECRSGEVISRFQRGARAERVTWRVSNNKVTDVHVQNVWLGQVLRDNYASVIQRGGGSIDALFHHLGARTGVELGSSNK
jgi:phospholipid transport system substrate-binding protein